VNLKFLVRLENQLLPEFLEHRHHLGRRQPCDGAGDHPHEALLVGGVEQQLEVAEEVLALGAIQQAAALKAEGGDAQAPELAGVDAEVLVGGAEDRDIAEVEAQLPVPVQLLKGADDLVASCLGKFPLTP
jgi:hypothetical protein